MSGLSSYRTITIGDSNVGKTHLIERYIDDKFEERPPSLHWQSCVKDFELNGKRFQLQLWDTAGQERFIELPANYYRNAIGALLVYDVTRRESFENLARWLDQVREKGHREMSVILVGNKCDLVNERVVSTEEGQRFAEEHGLRFFETSCKTPYNVTEVFEKMAELINEKLESGVIREDEIIRQRLQNNQQASSSGKCACW